MYADPGRLHYDINNSPCFDHVTIACDISSSKNEYGSTRVLYLKHTFLTHLLDNVKVLDLLTFKKLNMILDII